MHVRRQDRIPHMPQIVNSQFIIQKAFSCKAKNLTKISGPQEFSVFQVSCVSHNRFVENIHVMPKKVKLQLQNQ